MSNYLRDHSLFGDKYRTDREFSEAVLFPLVCRFFMDQMLTGVPLGRASQQTSHYIIDCIFDAVKVNHNWVTVDSKIIQRFADDILEGVILENGYRDAIKKALHTAGREIAEQAKNLLPEAEKYLDQFAKGQKLDAEQTAQLLALTDGATNEQKLSIFSSAYNKRKLKLDTAGIKEVRDLIEMVAFV